MFPRANHRQVHWWMYHARSWTHWTAYMSVLIESHTCFSARIWLFWVPLYGCTHSMVKRCAVTLKIMSGALSERCPGPKPRTRTRDILDKMKGWVPFDGSISKASATLWVKLNRRDRRLESIFMFQCHIMLPFQCQDMVILTHFLLVETSMQQQ